MNDTDLVVFFVSEKALESIWVKEELDWALEREKKLGYTFIFPIVLDLEAWKKLPKEFQDRRFLKLLSFEAIDIANIALKLKNEWSDSTLISFNFRNYLALIQISKHFQTSFR